MYIPPSFRITDPAKLAAFMDAHSFATLVSIDGSVPFATHLPVRLHTGDRGHVERESGGGDQADHGTLVSHMARANPQWNQFRSDREVLAIFHGPHSYVSPSWYATEPAVPTWNYAVVHAYGVPRILDDHDRVVELLDETVKAYESALERPWPGILPDEFRDKLIRSIVAFEMPISRIEGKFKLGQNRGDEDRQGVFDSLVQSTDDNARELANLMRAEGVVDARPQDESRADDRD